MVKLFMLDGILRLGAIQGLFRFVLEFIWDWFRVGYIFLWLALFKGWFGAHLGLV